ncbi:MAG: PAS domain S-box protein, partial [Chloroflexota bacterium]|nr:PAS domain S-box protein [Chloroflexota bacterium]
MSDFNFFEALEQETSVLTTQMDSDQLHELLTQYEQNFRLVFDNAPLGILVTDSVGLIKLLNTRAEKMFGYERDELLGETIERLIPVGLRGKHVLQRANIYDNPHAREMGIGFEVVGQRKNNEMFPVEVGLSVIQHENSIRVISYVSDITKRDRAAKELKDSEQRFKLLLESTPDAILLINSDGRIIHTNKVVEEMFGYKNDELIDQFLEVLIPGGNQLKHVQDRVKHTVKLHSREMGSGPDIHAIRKDLSAFPVDINLNN